MGSVVIMDRCLVVLSLLVATTTAIPPGWKTWLSTNLNEYENVGIPWENPAAVPDWLTGTYVKNGPGRISFGNMSYGNWLDGWAKINKFNINSSGMNLTSKFLRTPTYEKCQKSQEIVPAITLGPVIPDPWGITDMLEIVRNRVDNTPVTVTKMGEEFIASTDWPSVNILNISSLEWKELYDPGLGSGSTAHWRHEPGTDNMLNIQIKGIPGTPFEYLHLYRYPGGDLRHPQDVDSFHLPHSTLIHMFSVTENYAVFFIYPVAINSVCLMKHIMHNLLECLEWSGDTKSTDVFVMSLKTGKVVSHTKTEGSYSAHHINAYEKKENGLEVVVVDVIFQPWDTLATLFDLDTLLHWHDSGVMYNSANITRFHIDLHNNQISTLPWDNISPTAQPYYNQFDFPVINPEYEGRPYCYAYGQTMVENFRQYLIKKNICDSTQDKVWYKENHYNGEPYFIPRPGSTQEDDGVLLVIVLDGSTELSYLLLLDGITFETITEALLPTYIPFPSHGNWFPSLL